jgi:hypothetical protein
MQDKNGNKIVAIFDNSYNNSIRHVSTHLRAADFDEVFAATGKSPHICIELGWKLSLKRWIIFDRNNCAVAVLGIRPVDAFSNIGIPWLLGTDGLNKMSKFFLKISKPIIEEMKAGFDVLVNFIDARYIETVRWMRWCGFTVDEAQPFGELKLPFHRAYMEII